MRIGNELDVDEIRLAELCSQFHVAELLAFGSVLRADFADDSDIDLLYVLEKDANVGWEIVDFQEELTALFGRHVDLVAKNFLRPRFAQRVLPEAERISMHAA